ncbi:hypothetical protein K525DRAFT_275636, partial [Schizophyllum commune Loenen D]
MSHSPSPPTPTQNTDLHPSPHPIPISPRPHANILTTPPAPDGTPPPYKYVWRTPLRTTAAYWRGWFEGLSQAFLDAKTARLLVLA